YIRYLHLVLLRLAYAMPLSHLENDSQLDQRIPGFALILLHSHDAATLGVGKIFNLVHEGANPQNPSARRVEQVLRLSWVRQARRVETRAPVSYINAQRVRLDEKLNVNLFVG